MNHSPIKCYLRYLLCFIFVTLILSSTEPQEISLDYVQTDIAIDDVLYYKLSLSLALTEGVKYIKFQTIPQSQDSQITFFISPEIGKPDYSLSLFKAESAGTNTVIVSIEDIGETATVLYLSVYSTDSKQVFSLSCIKQNEPTLEVGEEISLLSKYIRTFKVQPKDFLNPVFFYALGANIDLFTIGIKLVNVLEQESNDEFSFEVMFRNGYGALFDKDRYPQYDMSKSYFEITIQSEVNENVAFGIKALKTIDNSITMLKQTYGYLTKESSSECYSVPTNKNVLINVMSYNSPTEIDLANTNGDVVEPISTEMIDSIHIDFAKKPQTITLLCFKKPALSLCDFITYSVQFIEYAQIETKQRFLSPIINGIQSKYILPSQKAISLRKRKGNINIEANSQMHLSISKGSPRLYSSKCEKYPCEYSISSISDLESQSRIVKGNLVNKNYCVSDEIITEPDYDSPEKLLSVVSCPSNEDCEFYLTMFETSDVIELNEHNEFHNALSKSAYLKMQYRLTNFSLMSISFILYCYSGDAKFEVYKEDQTGIDLIESFNGNKKVITVNKKDEALQMIGDYLIMISPNEDTYYSIAVVLHKQDTIALNTGELLLQSITENEKTKTFQIRNSARKTNTPFVISFNSLNCILNQFIFEALITADPFIIYQSDPLYSNEYIDITINFESYLSQTNNKDLLCLFYISGVEVDPQKALTLSEGVMHKMKLVPKKIETFRYTYPMSYDELGYGNTIIVDITYYDKDTPLMITSSFEGNKGIWSYEDKINRGRKLKFESELNKSCDYTSICSLHVSIHASGDKLLNELLYTITVKSLKKVPAYLKSNSYRKDVVVQDTMQYFYTSIGHNEEGEVMVSFNKGAGTIYARIVESDLRDPEAEYNNHIDLPNKTTNEKLLLKYNYSKRRIHYDSMQTSQCSKGCELYIGVLYDYHSDSTVTQGSLVSEFSIIKRVISKDTVTKLNVNEYAYGSIDSLDAQNQFTFAAPFDTSELRFHVFSDVAKVTVSLKEPIAKTWEISDPKGILTITQKEIEATTMKDIEVSLIVQVTKIIMKSSQYAIKVSASVQNIPTLNYLTSEQNEVCIFDEPSSSCNLIRSVNGYENISTFFMMIESMNNRHNSFVIYANVLSDEKFETNFTDDDLPTPSNHQKSSMGNLQENMLFIDKIPEQATGNYYIVIRIIASEIGKGLLLSSAISNVENITLNHNTKTMIFEKRNSEVLFNLHGGVNYLVSYTLIMGHGELVIENQPRIPLENSIIAEIPEISSNDRDFLIKATSDDLMYYISYMEISTKQLREIAFGTETKLILTNPILNSNYYFKVPSTKEKDCIIIILKFLKYAIKTPEGNTEEFVFNAYVTNYEFISSAIDDSTIKPDESTKVKGVYDPISREGKIIINTSADMSFNEYFVFLELEQGDLNKNTYSILEPHITAYPLTDVHSIYNLPQKRYFHNAIEADVAINLLKLTKYSTNDNTMIVEFSSCVGDSIEVSLRNYSLITDIEDLELLKNETSIKFTFVQQLNKDILSIDIKQFDSLGFVISRKTSSSINKRLDYVIRYETGENIQPNIPDKNNTSMTLTLTNNNSTINMVIIPLSNSTGHTIKADYVFRIITGTSELQKQNNSICTSKHEQDTILTRNQIETNSKEMTFSSFGLKIEYNTYYYLSLVAITENEEDILGFEGKYIKIDPPVKASNWVTILFIVIGSLIGISLLGSMIYYCVKRKRIQNTDILSVPSEPLYTD